MPSIITQWYIIYGHLSNIPLLIAVYMVIHGVHDLLIFYNINQINYYLIDTYTILKQLARVNLILIHYSNSSISSPPSNSKGAVVQELVLNLLLLVTLFTPPPPVRLLYAVLFIILLLLYILFTELFKYR